MRKLFLIITIILISFCVKAQYNDVKLGVTFASYNLTYQRTINENFTTAVGIDIGRYRYGTQSGTEIDGTEVTFRRMGYGIVGEFHFYPFENFVAPKVFFTGIHVRDFIVEEQDPDITVTNNILNAGLNFGYQWIWGNFTMEVLGGYGFSKAISVDSDRNLFEPVYQDDLNNLGRIRVQFCIGIVFPKFKNLN